MGTFYFNQMRINNEVRKKQMRTLVEKNRINVIIRPAISGFGFPRFDMIQDAQITIDHKEGTDWNKDRNRLRYRRK